jgi:hypothetical protein
MVAGIVLLAVGTAMAAVAAPFLQTGTQTCTFNGTGFDCSTPGPTPALITVEVLGIVQALGGIGLLLYGAPRVATNEPSSADRSVPAWAGQPVGLGWRWKL